MKTVSVLVRSALAVVFAIVMSSASCDLFDKVDDVTVDVTLSHTFHINEEAVDDDGKEYFQYELLDAAKVNSDFDKYKDKIKSITITSITYTVQNCGTAGVIFSNGYVGSSAATVSVAPTQLAELGVQDVKAAEGDELDLPYSQAALDQLAELLRNDKQANLYLLGTFSKTPAQFDVLVKVKCAMTADAL